MGDSFKIKSYGETSVRRCTQRVAGNFVWKYFNKNM